MPMRPPISCNYPACPGIALPGTSYCQQHQKKSVEVEQERQYGRQRPWYHLYNNVAWRKHLRPFILSRDPLCKLQLTEICRQHGGDPTSVADHIKDHKGDPKLFYDPANLQGVCAACHDVKTGETSHGDGADPAAPVQTGSVGKQFQSSLDTVALDKALEENGEDLDNVTIPEPPKK